MLFLHEPGLVLSISTTILCSFAAAALLFWPLSSRLRTLEAKAHFDPLTDLPSGLFFRDDIDSLQRSCSPVVFYLQVHRRDHQEVGKRGGEDLRRAAKAIGAALPRSADRLYRLRGHQARFGAILITSELMAIRLASGVLRALDEEGLSATIGIACTDRLGQCDLELAALSACEQQLQTAKGAWRIATEAPPKRPRQVPLSDEHPDVLSTPVVVS